MPWPLFRSLIMCGSLFGEVGERVHQRVSEEHEQSGEGQHGGHEHESDGGSPLQPPALQGHHRGVEHQGDEGGNEDPQDHLAQAADQPVQHPGHDDDGIDGQNGAEWDPLVGEGGEQPIAARGIRAGSSCRSSMRTVVVGAVAGALPTCSLEGGLPTCTFDGGVPVITRPSVTRPSLIASAWQVDQVVACQHEGNGGRQR